MRLGGVAKGRTIKLSLSVYKLYNPGKRKPINNEGQCNASLKNFGCSKLIRICQKIPNQIFIKSPKIIDYKGQGA